MAKYESEFRQYAVSSAGCQGFFQNNPNVHKIDPKRAFEAYYNTEMACKDFINKSRAYKNLKNTLNGYNGWVSEKNTYATNVLKIKNKLDKI